MSLRCNNCNEVLGEFGCDYNTDVISYYEYDKKEKIFKLTSQIIDNNKDTNFYCIKCGKTLSDEVINKLGI